MNKKIVLADNLHSIKDDAEIEVYGGGLKGTRIQIKNSFTGETIFDGSNSVIVPGSLFTVKSHFPDIENLLQLQSYNSLLDLDNIIAESDADIKATKYNKVRGTYLFCVGIDGEQQGQILPVDKTKRIETANLVPLRVLDSADTTHISELDSKNLYYGKKTDLTDSTVKYYFKTWSTTPICKAVYADGTSITSDMYSQTLKDPRIIVEVKFSVTPEDCREYFKRYSTIAGKTRLNSLSLLTAWYTEDDKGIKTYQDIQPSTKLNFTTEDLTDETKGLDIIYHLYY